MAAGEQSETKPKLVLIDGNSLVYRAFFALPESIATSTGFPTNAILGFASMLVKLVDDLGVVPTIVVWDAGSSGRKEVHAEYKGHRPSQPDLLREQYPHLRPLAEAFGHRNLSVDGFEADDVIATIAERAKGDGVEVTIVTGDRDAFQLVGDGVTVMATARGITDTKLYDANAVLERYGVGPELIPDLWGLKGDTSDNIPGVPGIGDKTAATLLQQFGTLEEVLEHVDEVSGKKRQENLREHADAARISKQLATAQRDVPLELDLLGEAARPPDRSKLRETFREFELREPLRRLEESLAELELSGEGEVPPPASDERTLHATVRDATLLDVSALPPGAEAAVAVVPIELAEEASPAEPSRQVLESGGAAPPPGGVRFAVAVGDDRADHGIELLVGEAGAAADLAGVLGDRPVVVHDAKGSLDAVPPGLAHDTLLAAYLLDPARRGYPLADLAAERGIGAGVEDQAGREALLTRGLADWQRAQLTERGLAELQTDVEIPLVSVLRDMERQGIRLDLERLDEVSDKVREELAGLEAEIHELAGEEFTIRSPQQLGQVLFEKLGLSRKRRGKTGFSTDARVLQAIRDEHPIVPKIERWRELDQLVKTYLDVLPQLTDPNGSRIRTTFVQAAATTGRLASTNPNLQNVPVRTPLGREIRRCFVAAPGLQLLAADYEQVELRVLAFVADEPVLREIFVRGEDVHTATAKQVFEVSEDELTPAMRSKAKMVNYGIVYGLSDFGLADRLNIPREEAKSFIDAYLARFSAVHAFMERTIEQAREEGHVLTLFGRRRQIPELRARNFQVRSLGERLAVNTVVQGTAADVLKLAMVGAHRALTEAGLATKLLLTIHDELLFEGPPEEEATVREIVEREMLAPWGERTPPLAVNVGVGRDWLEAK